jgi:peptidoglycan/xylan/chitin deacetylase (PgdA/CDA1 family)
LAALLMKRIVSQKLTAIRRSIGSAVFARTVSMCNRRAIVSFTFDDFPQSAVSNGARLLERNGARGTFYLTGSYCGRVIGNVLQYRADDLAGLVSAGHEIGCHTFSHSRVSTLPGNALDREIDLNASFLERCVPGLAFGTFAYPFGDFSHGAAVRLRSRFAGCRSSEPGLNTGTIDLGRLRSIRLYDTLIDSEKVSGLIKQAVTSTAWLIFYTHDVTEVPSSFGCTPSLLEHALKSAIHAGAEIRPVNAAIMTVVARSLRASATKNDIMFRRFLE